MFIINGLFKGIIIYLAAIPATLLCYLFMCLIKKIKKGTLTRFEGLPEWSIFNAGVALLIVWPIYGDALFSLLGL